MKSHFKEPVRRIKRSELNGVETDALVTSATGAALFMVCPYCQHSDTYLTAFFSGRALVLCDNESGGCDEYFAIAWIMQPTVKMYALEEQP